MVGNDGEAEEVEMKEEEMFEVEQVPLFYTRAPGDYKKNEQSKRLIHSSVVEKTVEF